MNPEKYRYKTDVFDQNVYVPKIITNVEYLCAFYSGLICLHEL